MRGRRWLLVLSMLIAANVRAQGDFVPAGKADDTQPPKLKPLPTGVILLPGAVPRASDSKTPLPEGGLTGKLAYENRYFGLTYPIPDEWYEEFKGPPPSESGLYVLADIVPSKSVNAGSSKGSILVTAQDHFFSPNAVSSAAEQIRYSHDHLPAFYKVERPPVALTIAGRQFERFDYMSPVAELHWYVLATQIRCHTVQFVFNSRDTALLEKLADGLKQLKISDADAPLCVADYARDENIIYKVDPALTDRKFNPIPVRIIIGKTGKVQHVHVLRAFEGQSDIVIDALLRWRFKPYLRNGEPVEIETGILFGSARSRKREPSSGVSASVSQ